MFLKHASAYLFFSFIHWPIPYFPIFAWTCQSIHGDVGVFPSDNHHPGNCCRPQKFKSNLNHQSDCWLIDFNFCFNLRFSLFLYNIQFFGINKKISVQLQNQFIYIKINKNKLLICYKFYDDFMVIFAL